ncbi:MAG: Ig-like domain-containing protein, partial [Anaerovoracaceae bacterium]
GAWGAPIRLTDNTVRDSNARGVFHRGDWFILWNQDERYVYRHGLAGETLSTASLEGVSGKTELTQGDAFIAMVYQKGGENNNRNLSALFYDIEKSSWSREIPLTTQPGYVRSFSPAFDAEGNLGLLYTHADIITEYIGDTAYDSPSNNVSLKFLNYTPKHDLAMDRDGAIVLSADHPAPETAVRVTCLVENKGDFAERAVAVLYEGTSAAGAKIGEKILDQPIPAGASVPVALDWIVPEEDKTEYKLYAEVVSTDEVAEVDPTNNVSYRTVFSSDVGLADVQWESLAGYQYLVKPLVFNEGSTPLENIEVVLSHNDTEVASTVVRALDPGEHTTVSFVVSSEGFPADPAGRYPMTATVSLPEDIQESTVDNNLLDFELDTRILSVRAMNPADGQQQVDIDEPITLAFNRLIIDKDGFDDIKLTDSYLNSVPVAKTIDQNVLTITAEDPLRPGTQYTLTLPENAVGDAFGRSMKTAESFSFTTVSQNPVPVFNTPFDRSADVATDTDIRIQFSEAITAGSAFNEIYLEQSISKLKIPVAVTVDDQWLTVKPLRVLSGNTAYAVHIPTGAVKNTNGDHQSADYDFTFTTAPGPEIPVEEPNADSRTKSKPLAAGELSLKGVLVDSLSGSDDWSMDQAGFYSLDLTQDAILSDGVRVTLSYGVLDQLLAAGSGLRITTEKGELIFPEQWIRNLSEDEKQSVVVVIAGRNEKDQEFSDDPSRVSGQLSITVTVGGRPMTEFDAPVRVVMPVQKEEIRNGQRVIACRYDEGTGTWVPLGGKADLDAGTITFRTAHFSDFAAFETVRSFADVTAAWAKEPVEILASRGLISGTKEGVFDPSRTITRAEFTAIVVRSLYGKPATEKGTFSDVALDAWYADAVETAAVLGIMSGMGKDRFAPLESMTREQLATIAYRLVNQMQNKEPREEVEAYGFADQNAIAPYAVDGVNYLASKGIMIGSFGAFDPKANLTRQEAAVVLYRLLEYVGEI